jgi:HEAT repeat protein
MLDDPNPIVRASGAHALSRFGARAAPALGPLQAQLDDRDPLARTYAAVALGEMGETASPALPKLEEMQKARDFRISGAAREAVSQIRGGGEPDPRRSESHRAPARLLGSPSEVWRASRRDPRR